MKPLTMLRIESLWKPNFCVRSRKMSSISSFESGIWRSDDQAGYGSRAPGPESTKVGVEASDMPMRGGPRDSEEGVYFWPYTSTSESVSGWADGGPWVNT